MGIGKIIGNDKQKRYTGNILSSSQRLLELITDILDLAKVEAGRMPVDPMPFDPAAELATALKLVQSLATEKEQSLILFNRKSRIYNFDF